MALGKAEELERRIRQLEEEKEMSKGAREKEDLRGGIAATGTGGDEAIPRGFSLLIPCPLLLAAKARSCGLNPTIVGSPSPPSVALHHFPRRLDFVDGFRRLREALRGSLDRTPSHVSLVLRGSSFSDQAFQSISRTRIRGNRRSELPVYFGPGGRDLKGLLARSLLTKSVRRISSSVEGTSSPVS